MVVRNHGADTFVSELQKFITLFIAPGRVLSTIPVTHIDLWYLVKFSVRHDHISASNAMHETRHIAYAVPERTLKSSEETQGAQKVSPARFDTVFVHNGTNTISTTDMQGDCIYCLIFHV